MYSPRLDPRLIPALRRYAWRKGQPMTRVVSEAIERVLIAEGFPPEAINAALPSEQRQRLEARR
jgi:hypothetical protein